MCWMLQSIIGNGNSVQHNFLTITILQFKIKEFKCTSERKRDKEKKRSGNKDRISTVKQNAF